MLDWTLPTRDPNDGATRRQVRRELLARCLGQLSRPPEMAYADDRYEFAAPGGTP